jgi:hypothetical protein
MGLYVRPARVPARRSDWVRNLQASSVGVVATVALFHSLALRFVKNLGRLFLRFLNLVFRHLVGALGQQ